MSCCIRWLFLSAMARAVSMRMSLAHLALSPPEKSKLKSEAAETVVVMVVVVVEEGGGWWG